MADLEKRKEYLRQWNRTDLHVSPLLIAGIELGLPML